jgi:hypothetical protein
MKTTRKRRTRHDRSADAPPAPPHASGTKLPLQVQPVIRGVMRDPFNFAVGAATSSCAECLATCSALGGPLRSVCERLCAIVCSA